MKGSACAKVILVGEHSVVYGEPAIAVPLPALRAEAVLHPGGEEGLRIIAPDVGRSFRLADAGKDDPLAFAVRLFLHTFGLEEPRAALQLRSAIPIAAGLGSGAAVTVAILRALAAATGIQPTQAQLNALAYEVEKLHHGTPSGIDNTVIVWERPVWFVRGEAPQPLETAGTLPLLVAQSGPAPATRVMVEGVRRRYEANPDRYGALFARMGDLAREARAALTDGDIPALGALLNENHHLLRDLGVSTPALDRLVEAALAGGAWGAKLTGAGGGGNLIALVPPQRRDEVRRALREAGATRILEA